MDSEQCMILRVTRRQYLLANFFQQLEAALQGLNGIRRGTMLNGGSFDADSEHGGLFGTNLQAY